MMFADQTDSPRRGGSSPMPATTASTSSTPPTCTRVGGSEQMVGELLEGPARTTGCWPPRSATRCRSGRTSRATRAAGCCASCDASLQRLRTDHVDIYYLHRDYNGMDLEEPLRALDALLRAGKIRYWGVSNFRGWRIAEMVHLARELGMPAAGGLPAVLQPAQPPARGRDAAGLRPLRHRRRALQPDRARRAGRQVRARRSRRPRARAPAAATSASCRPSSARSRCEIAQTLKAHCEGKGVALAQFATAWVLANRAVSAVIAGPRTLAQWQDYLGALDCTIGREDEALVDSLVAPGHPSTPGYNDPAYPLAAALSEGGRREPAFKGDCMTITITRDPSRKMKHTVYRANNTPSRFDEPCRPTAARTSASRRTTLYDSALGACKALTVLWYAQRKQNPFEDIQRPASSATTSAERKWRLPLAHHAGRSAAR